ncbi:16S rRNA (uracil(1498)-N(3))-methyltransferase [Bacteriovoracaceae bacterium]|nr:16S rRNA (uracil(1498)-N(3))-methyltransferase [Bacteriovoracaceae bacterium]
MRSLYIPELSTLNLNDNFEIRDLDFHHLARVARVKTGDQIKIILGQGRSFLAQIEKISKKEICCQKIGLITIEERLHHISLAVGINRPDTFKSLIQMSCELGIQNIYVVHTDHSSNKLISMSKIENLLKMGVEQSNAVFVPQLHILENIEKLIEISSSMVCFINGLSSDTESQLNDIKNDGHIIMLVGPEGGFSEKEKSILWESGSVRKVSLKTPIMRTETAVATCFGFLLQLNKD